MTRTGEEKIKRAVLAVSGAGLVALVTIAALMALMERPTSPATPAASSGDPYTEQRVEIPTSTAVKAKGALDAPATAEAGSSIPDPPTAEQSGSHDVVATIDEISITYSVWQTSTLLDQVMSRLTRQPIPSAEQTLDRLVNETLLLRGAELDGASVTPAEVKERTASLEAAWGLSDAEVASELQAAGLTHEALAERVGHLILVERAITALSAQHPDLDGWLAQARRAVRVGLNQPLAPVTTVESETADGESFPNPTPLATSTASEIALAPDRVVAPQPGALAPDFALSTLDGQTMRLNDLRGRPVLLNFWATWCPACRKELPALQAAYERYGDRVAFLAVDVKESPEAVSPVVSRFALAFPVLLDQDGAVSDRLYQVRGIPTTLIVGADGVISARHVGPLTEAAIDGYLEPTLLAAGDETPGAQAADMAPDFALKSAGGATVTLGQYRGQSSVVLVFYRGQT